MLVTLTLALMPLLVQVHIATLIQLQGARADPIQLERLQTMLCEKNTEIQNLLTKVRQMEKEEVRTETTTRQQNELSFWRLLMNGSVFISETKAYLNSRDAHAHSKIITHLG